MLGRSTISAFTTALFSSALVGAQSSWNTTAPSNTTAPFPAKTFAQCQKKTSPILDGCPEGTIFVSATHPNANFTTIQSAIVSIPNDTDAYYILIEAGNYTEQLNVTRQGPLYLLGQSDRPSNGKIYADINVNTTAQNDVQIWWNQANVGGNLYPDNVYTQVLTVAPTLNASLTGSGPTGFAVPDDTPFGSSDFRAYNIDFRNEFTPYSNGPALTIGISRANAGFYSCGFYSWQDTIYIGKLGNAYFYDTITAGQTDFLYGFGTLYIAKSTLSLRHYGGGITAWKGANTTFENKYGVYIDESQVIASNYTDSLAIVGKVALGRPWNALHRSIYMESYLDASILPAGYIQWSATDPRTSTSTMAMWNNFGPGWNTVAEEASNITKVFDDEDVEPYRWPVDVFLEEDGTPENIFWIDQSVLVPF